MGAEVRTVRIQGRTFKDAWRNVVEEDIHDKGRELYNSGLVHIDGHIPIMAKEQYDKAVADDNIAKHNAIAYCIQKPILNENQIKTDVIRHPNKGTRKWETVYVAVPSYGASDYAPVNIMETTLGAAITKARAYVEKHPDYPLQIKIAKKLAGPKGEELCAEIKYKKSSRERDGIWEVTAVVPC